MLLFFIWETKNLPPQGSHDFLHLASIKAGFSEHSPWPAQTGQDPATFASSSQIPSLKIFLLLKSNFIIILVFKILLSFTL